MARPYSMDLRERAVGSVERGEMSRRQAAAHDRVGVSTVISWVRRRRETGSVKPGKMGGHCPKKLIGHWRTWLLDRCRNADFTLRGLVAELAELGLKVDDRSVWEFVHGEKLTHKKRMARPVCKGKIGWRAGLHQRIRSRGLSPGQDGFRARRAS